MCFAYSTNVASSAVNWSVLRSRQSRCWVFCGMFCMFQQPNVGPTWLHLLCVPHGSPMLLLCQLYISIYIRRAGECQPPVTHFISISNASSAAFNSVLITSTGSNVRPELQSNLGKQNNIIVALDHGSSQIHPYSKFCHLSVNKVLLLHSAYLLHCL